ncbi:MAG TPA: FecR family protein [Planctomycetota bacterium]|nr:FecR family protein [Planctomycetota bacterium]
MSIAQKEHGGRYPLLAAPLAMLFLLHGAILAEETIEDELKPEAQPPIGYILEVSDDERESEADNYATIIHNGKEVFASHGMPVYAGDTVTTGAESMVGVAFVDSCAVTLRETTRLKILEYEYPNRLKPTKVELEDGRAYFDINPRPVAAHFFIKTTGGEVEVKGTKFQVYSVPDGGGSFTTSVAVTQGTVTLQPNGANAVDILNGTQVIVNVRNPKVAGFSGDPVTISKGNIDKNTIKTLKKGAFFGTEVQINKKGQVKIKSQTLNGDGSVTKLQVTEIAGKRVKSVSTTKDGKVTTLKTNFNKDRASISRVEGSQKIAEKFKGNVGKTTIKDKSTKQSFVGTIKKLRDGLWVSDTSVKKDGTRLVIRREILPDGTEITHKTVFKKGASTGVETKTTRLPSGKVMLETCGVTTIPIDDGVFEKIPGTTVVGNATPPKRDAPPEEFTPVDKLVPLPPPKGTTPTGGEEDPPPGGGGDPPPPEPPVSR